jgi:hypothetical protein
MSKNEQDYEISLKILQRKQKISDDVIFSIRDKLKQNVSKNKIRKEHIIKYETLIDIMKGKLFPLSEFTYENYLKIPRNYYKPPKSENKHKIKKRAATTQETMFILEKSSEGWKPIRIYNAIKQKNPDSKVNLDRVKKFAKGTVVILESELSPEDYLRYFELREQLMNLHINKN